MLDSFIRSIPSYGRLAVLAAPSRGTFSLIERLWDANHIVFPILPNRLEYVNHLITEGRCRGILSPLSSLENVTRQLGVPLVKYTVPNTLLQKPSKIGSVIVEGKYYDSSIPLAAQIDENVFRIYAKRNREIIANSGKVISLSKHWVLDAVSLGSDAIFSDDELNLTPSTIIVDSDSLSLGTSVIRAEGNIERIIITVSDSFCVSSLREELNSLFPNVSQVDLRFFVPEFGPIARVVSLKSFEDLSSLAAHASVSVKLENEKLMVSSAYRFSSYIGRPRTSEACLKSDGFFDTSISVKRPVEIERKATVRRKRKIMQPDWRVRQVPIAVYHKKRGFKGQIYYTTKHKGWTLYRSRYYN